MTRGSPSPAVIKASMERGERMFPSTSEHAAAQQPPSLMRIVNTFFRKYFVSFALPEALVAPRCWLPHSKALAARAWSSSLIKVPPNCGPFLRLTCGLDGDKLRTCRSIGAMGRQRQGPSLFHTHKSAPLHTICFRVVSSCFMGVGYCMCIWAVTYMYVNVRLSPSRPAFQDPFSFLSLPRMKINVYLRPAVHLFRPHNVNAQCSVAASQLACTTERAQASALGPGNTFDPNPKVF
jgi:hypothetical protein